MSESFFYPHLELENCDEMLAKAKEEGYSCIGAPGAINALGFMVGEAGIKYLLNRYTRNDIRSILLCENI